MPPRALASAAGNRTTAASRRLAFRLLAPAGLLVGGVVVVPLLLAFYLSLHRAEPAVGGLLTRFVGLANYRYYLIESPLFWPAVRVTLYFTLASLGLELVLGLGMALVLDQPFFGRPLVRALVLLPWGVPTVVNARMWEWIYAGANYGALNGLLKTLHLLPPGQDVVWLGFDVPFAGVPVLGSLFEWLGASRALHMIILADTWKVTPLVVLLFLAGLQTVPASLHEAATLDGAGFWQRLRHVVLPLLRPVLLVILVLRTMELFRVFDVIYILMQYSIRVLGVFTYETGMKFLHFGRGSALAFLISLFIAGLSLVYMKWLYTDDEAEVKGR
ncbi:ABC transporter permease [Limnochorda pilosa]|uniref:ABC transporter permease n=1 Tax=Limnochorda pilosa TaxID=1555112 RepID=A0A0K2SJV8_LIMPI|nr:ABC transporter permease [Limnochorda pilosa]